MKHTFLLVLAILLMRNVAADSFQFYLQTGAFATEADAQIHSAKLRANKFHSVITARERDGKAVYRVRVGPFENKAISEDINSRLQSIGVNAVFIRVEGAAESPNTIPVYRVTDPVNCVIVRNAENGTPMARNNCDFSVWVASCVDTTAQASANAREGTCAALASSGKKRFLQIFPGRESGFYGGLSSIQSGESNVQYIAACENPNKRGFGGGSYADTAAFYKVVYSGAGVTASCLTPELKPTKAGRIEEHSDPYSGRTERIRVINP